MHARFVCYFLLIAIASTVIGCSQPRTFKDVLLFRQACTRLLGEKEGAIVVTDPRTGLVLALVNEQMAVRQAYGPGSAFKMVVALTVLQTGIDETAEVLCSGVTKIGGREYSCWLRKGHGRVDLVEALAQSCNVYFYHLGARLEAQRILHLAGLLGLGSRTGINVGGEVTGSIPTDVGDDEVSKLAVGQCNALRVTAVQMARLIAAVANGGQAYRLFYPRDAVELEHFTPHLLGTLPLGTGLQLVREGLRQSVLSGTCACPDLQQVQAAGKTGTASKQFGYFTDAWFLGYAPFQQPEVAVVVLLARGTGAADAVPLAGKILREYFITMKK